MAGHVNTFDCPDVVADCEVVWGDGALVVGVGELVGALVVVAATVGDLVVGAAVGALVEATVGALVVAA